MLNNINMQGDKQGGQMPRSSSGGWGGIEFDQYITEKKNKNNDNIEPYYQGKISLFVRVSHRSFPFFSPRL